MTKRLTQEEFEKRVKEQGNGEFEILGEYKGRRKKVRAMHLKCGHEWGMIPDSFFGGRRCPKCARVRIDNNKFIDMVKKLSNGEYTVLGEYKHQRMPVKMKHESCGQVWYPTLKSLRQGKGCPRCAGRPIVTTDEYKNRVKDITEEYEVIGEYRNRRTGIKMFHKECGRHFDMSPDEFLKGNRCPLCRQSKGEKEVEIYLKNLQIYFEPQKRFEDCRHKATLPFDFYIPSLNVAIEYDGIQHYKPLEVWGGVEAYKQTKLRDVIKNNYCETNGIRLIRIRYDQEVEEVLRKELVISNEIYPMPAGHKSL